jgi:hypothetical protein
MKRALEEKDLLNVQLQTRLRLAKEATKNAEARRAELRKEIRLVDDGLAVATNNRMLLKNTLVQQMETIR